jgi:hypothetical protein
LTVPVLVAAGQPMSAKPVPAPRDQDPLARVDDACVAGV